VACIGGGVGTAELYPIACALKAAGNTIHTIIGARSKELVILEEEMRRTSDALYVTTDDGSYARKGFVTDPLTDLLKGTVPIHAVYAIGPLPMMKAVSNVTRQFSVPTYVSLNTIMVDGTGMCGGCRVTIGGKMKFACVDGPEFDGHQVDFDELMMRNRTYLDMENSTNLPPVSSGARRTTCTAKPEAVRADEDQGQRLSSRRCTSTGCHSIRRGRSIESAAAWNARASLRRWLPRGIDIRDSAGDQKDFLGAVARSGVNYLPAICGRVSPGTQQELCVLGKKSPCRDRQAERFVADYEMKNNLLSSPTAKRKR
jgi:hypothetical protein